MIGKVKKSITGLAKMIGAEFFRLSRRKFVLILVLVILAGTIGSFAQVKGQYSKYAKFYTQNGEKIPKVEEKKPASLPKDKETLNKELISLKEQVKSQTNSINEGFLTKKGEYEAKNNIAGLKQKIKAYEFALENNIFKNDAHLYAYKITDNSIYTKLYVFEKVQQSLKIIIYIATILLMAFLFTADISNNTFKMQALRANSRSKILLSKSITAYLFMLLIVFITSLLIFIMTSSFPESESLMLGIKDNTTVFKITQNKAMFFIVRDYAISILLIIEVVAFLTIIVKNTIMVIGLSAIIFILPNITKSFFSKYDIDYFNPIHMLNPSSLFRFDTGIGSNVSYSKIVALTIFYILVMAIINRILLSRTEVS